MGEDATQGDDRSQTRRRLTVPEAAEALGVSVEAVRGRIKRDTIEHERIDGTVYVYVDADQGATSVRPDTGQSHDQSELVEALREQIDYLRDQLAEEREARRRADTIIAQLTQANATLAGRVPELEAPAEPAEASDSSDEPQETTSRPWWRRWFGVY